MLSYQHIHHAGNFADVIKHITLLSWLQAALDDPEPVRYLDTHAGGGRYNLRQAKTNAYVQGAGRLVDSVAPPPEVAQYLHHLAATAPLYPGSPELARRVLRSQDRLWLCERHPATLKQLRALLASDRRVRIEPEDGLSRLAALTQPKRGSGLTLIDPPYERQAEYAEVVTALHRGYQRWPTCGYLLWYPLVREMPRDFLAKLAGGVSNAVRVELRLHPANLPLGLNGCGLLLVNAPVTVLQALPHWLAWLAPRLAQGMPPSWHIEPLG